MMRKGSPRREVSEVVNKAVNKADLLVHRTWVWVVPSNPMN